jgi:hypothetical protein
LPSMALLRPRSTSYDASRLCESVNECRTPGTTSSRGCTFSREVQARFRELLAGISAVSAPPRHCAPR